MASDAYYVMVQDDDGHWYVIPADRINDFRAWVATCGDEEQPIWVASVGGSPSLVLFRQFDIRG